MSSERHAVGISAKKNRSNTIPRLFQFDLSEIYTHANKPDLTLNLPYQSLSSLFHTSSLIWLCFLSFIVLLVTAATVTLVAATVMLVTAAVMLVTSTVILVTAAVMLATVVRGITPSPMSHFLLIPIISMPVLLIVPSPPVSTEVSIVYPVISTRQVEIIIRRYIHDHSWDKRRLNIGPGSGIDVRPVPVISIESVPDVIVEIKARRARHHIDITWATRNNHDIRRSWKYQRWEGQANADIYFPGRTNRLHTHNKKQRNHK